ncbi:MFS transporter [Pedobacter changchengzhani]|uniref:MFS transporter n=1 Tax=Pedobacter changchengzhani TaxID=2529274 RepID=A0A4R5MQD6_9SPHI|nr:MFS transporter [Pedobacter changchengzhani]TDG37948.1 MFS transporter [Pedobacter changchengzhani]
MDSSSANQDSTNQPATGSASYKISPNRIRVAVSLFYFGQGIAFASWASRIPDIKHSLNLSDGQLGSILLALPAGQLLTMFFSGRLVTRFGSKRILTITAPLYVLALSNLGLATAPWHLTVFLFLFGVIGNMCNISVNTQGAEAEKLFGRPIMTSFHGAWSIAGFTGALVGLLMMNLHVIPYYHFWFIVVLIWINVFFNHKYLVPGKGAVRERSRKFVMPDSSLLQLGIIGFCSMATEGAMFDWSGVYFKEIVKAPASLVILGYASFMVMMATGRFVGDKIIAKLGRRRTIQFSGLIISSGMFLSVLFPHIITATLGFMLVGIGVASIVPSLYSIAGKHNKVAPGIAITIVSGVSYFGFLLGPPLIGGISQLSSLQYSYGVIGCFGLLISFLVVKIKAID